MSLGAGGEAGALRADGPPPVRTSHSPEQPGIGPSALTRARRHNPYEHNPYEHCPNSTTNSPEAVLAVLASRTTLYVTSPDSSYHRGVVHAFHSCDVAVREPVVVHDGPLRIAECERCRAGHAGVQSAPLATCRLFPEPGLLMPMNAPACPVAAHRAPGDPNLSIGQGYGELAVNGARPS